MLKDHLRGYSRGVGPVDQLICASAPDIYRPNCFGFFWSHELCAEIERLGITCCDNSTSLVSFVQASTAKSAGQLQPMRMVLVHLYTAFQGTLFHLSATQLSRLDCRISAEGRS